MVRTSQGNCKGFWYVVFNQFSLRGDLFGYIRFKCGKGSSVWSWRDLWCGEADSFPGLYMLSENKLVLEFLNMWREWTWAVKFILLLFFLEIEG